MILCTGLDYKVLKVLYNLLEQFSLIINLKDIKSLCHNIFYTLCNEKT